MTSALDFLAYYTPAAMFVVAVFGVVYHFARVRP